MKLEGKVALITGAGRNIGRAIALKFAGEGADIIVNARSNEAEANAVVEEVRALGRRAIAVLADVSDATKVREMVATGLAEFGRIDVLISNAAIRPSKPFVEVTDEDWENVRGVVLDGAFYVTRAVVPSMIDNKVGGIVFLTGDGAFGGSPDRSHVSAAKMGLVGLARGLARDLGQHNIRVNIVSPGLIDTTRPGTWYPAGFAQNPGGPMKRLGTPDEIADACLFLVSGDSSFMTGQTLHVNGGTGFY
ncbi:MAG: SDR family oxidoreductase [Chloroflexi bacterium]|nr:SDR family oxidoreductase [Chloroflexota bacterium]